VWSLGWFHQSQRAFFPAACLGQRLRSDNVREPRQFLVGAVIGD